MRLVIIGMFFQIIITILFKIFDELTHDVPDDVPPSDWRVEDLVI